MNFFKCLWFNEKIIGGIFLNMNVFDFSVVVFGTFFVHFLSFILFNVPYLLFEYYNLFQQFKINKNENVSWERKIFEFKRLFKGLFFETLPLQIVSYPIFYYFGVNTLQEFPTL